MGGIGDGQDGDLVARKCQATLRMIPVSELESAFPFNLPRAERRFYFAEGKQGRRISASRFRGQW